MNGTNGKGKESSPPYSLKQHNEELARQKDEYTLEEAAKLVENGLATLKDYQRGEKNLIIHVNSLLYERRKLKDSICPHCHGNVTHEEKWYLLGESVEAKKEGGIEKKLEESVEAKKKAEISNI